MLSFCLALVASNMLAVIKAALRVTHGTQKVEAEVSLYYFALELSGVYPGMMIAVPAEHWEIFQHLSAGEMATFLKGVAAQVRLQRYPRQPRGPKKPPPRRTKSKKHPHVSTARVLAERRKTTAR